MSRPALSAAVSSLSRAARPDDATDSQLVARFARVRDEAAFVELVRRLGPMVLAVCRRVSGDSHLADDAFQAAFLVLARRATDVPPGAVRGWLYGVAVRTAREARAVFARRSAREHPVADLPDHPAQPVETPDADALRALDEEIAALPDHLRVAVVLCEIGGTARADAADQLGIPEGTVRSRLARARKVLAARLRKRGIVSSAAALAALGTASAAVPPRLGDAAIALTAPAAAVPPAVAILTTGVFRTMFLHKLKAVAIGGLFAALTLAAGVAGWDQLAAGSSPAAPAAGAASHLAVASGPIDSAIPAPPTPRKPAAAKTAAVVAKFVERLKAQTSPLPPGKDDLGLFLMDLDKGDVTLIASVLDRERAYCGSPSWSEDGRRIYFDSSPGFGRFTETRVHMLELTDRGVALTTFGPGNCPTTSPDGKQLAYRLNTGAVPGVKAGIYLTKADGSPWYHLDRGGFAKWSPDGKHLLAISFSNPCDLALVTVEGGKERSVVLADHRIYSVPSWADDGLITALVRSNQTQKFAIALVDVTNPEKATVKETLWKRGDGTNVEPLYPVYSPTRRRGVFVGREPKGQALYEFEPGKAPSRLEPKRRLDPKVASLALSPDGRYILFCSARPDDDK